MEYSYDIRDVSKKVFYDKSSVRQIVIGYGDGYSQIRQLEDCQGLRWQLPNIDSSVLASTANELRRDKYTPVNPEKLKAAAVGLSQSSAALMVGQAASKLELHNELNNYLTVSTSTSVIVDKSSDGEFLRIDFNVRLVWERIKLQTFGLSLELQMMPVTPVQVRHYGAKNSPKTQSTADLPYDKVKYLKMAYDQLQQPMTQLLADMAPDWVIYDFAPYWLGPVAAKLGISSVFFSIFIAATLCFVGPIPVLKGEDDRTTPRTSLVDDENIPGTYRLGAGIEACDVLAVRSSYEFEPEWLKLLQQIHQKPITPIGLLPTTAYDSSDNGEAWTEIKEWLFIGLWS
ncbi:hypothetical protein TEA_023513 [Camellia sinensis var. sinensis]|uniref:Uncharacterized protein n=1 Tax=Camellia sinensis var. sinensis TaxID=542762 RepID=A0A4S4DYC6_CAMSN|nr:hypothetical protein TEA_023513 [Camellia sinensis var. sinensis]